METMEARAPRIFAVGGGKGGVGKSIVASNLALALAATGQRTAVVDVDLGGANLHTLFGVTRPRATLADFVRGDVADLAELLVPTSVPDVALISGARALPDMANPKYAHKQQAAAPPAPAAACSTWCSTSAPAAASTWWTSSWRPIAAWSW